LIPGCPAEELLDVAHVIVKTVKSIEGKILEQYFMNSAVAKKVH